MDDTMPDIVPECPLCTEAQLAVKHVLLICPALERQRRECIGAVSGASTPTMRDILGTNLKVGQIVTYLRRINAYNKI